MLGRTLQLDSTRNNAAMNFRIDMALGIVVRACVLDDLAQKNLMMIRRVFWGRGGAGNF